MPQFYLTTAIDYVNSRPHLGTAYEKVTADVIARYQRLRGVDTHFLMGNDEHSQNVHRRAQELGLEPIRDRAWKLAAHLRKLLSDHDRVKVLDRGAVLGATVTASVDGWAPANLVRELRARGINTTGQARIDAIIDYAEKGIDGSLRISPHYFNTEEELSTFVNALDEIIS